MNRTKYHKYNDYKSDHMIKTVEEYNQLVNDIKEDNDSWIKIIKTLIKEYYSLPGNGCGGPLHIVLDDGNIEDHNLHWCQGLTHGIEDYAGNDIASLMLFMTIEQRKRILQDRIPKRI